MASKTEIIIIVLISLLVLSGISAALYFHFKINKTFLNTTPTSPLIPITPITPFIPITPTTPIIPLSPTTPIIPLSPTTPAIPLITPNPPSPPNPPVIRVLPLNILPYSTSIYKAGPAINNPQINVVGPVPLNVQNIMATGPAFAEGNNGEIIIKKRGTYLSFGRVSYSLSKDGWKMKSEQGKGYNALGPQGKLFYNLESKGDIVGETLGINTWYGGDIQETSNREDSVMDAYDVSELDSVLKLNLMNNSTGIDNQQEGYIWLNNGHQWIIDVPNVFDIYKYKDDAKNTIVTVGNSYTANLKNIQSGEADSGTVKDSGIYMIFVKATLQWAQTKKAGPTPTDLFVGPVASIQLIANGTPIPGTGFKRLYNGDGDSRGFTGSRNSRGPITISIMAELSAGTHIDVKITNNTTTNNDAQFKIQCVSMLAVQISSALNPVDHIFGYYDGGNNQTITYSQDTNEPLSKITHTFGHNIIFSDGLFTVTGDGYYAVGVTIYYFIGKNNIYHGPESPQFNGTIILQIGNDQTSEYLVNITGKNYYTQFGQIQSSAIIPLKKNNTFSIRINNSAPPHSNSVFSAIYYTFWVYRVTNTRTI